MSHYIIIDIYYYILYNFLELLLPLDHIDTSTTVIDDAYHEETWHIIFKITF